MKKIGFLLIVVLIISACENNRRIHKHSDKFYSEKGGFDMARIPLIKPYEVVTPSKNVDWIVSVSDMNESPPNIPGVKDVNIIDSTIFIYSRNSLLEGQSIKEAWYIIIPKKKFIQGFKSRQEYLRYLDSNRIKQPKMFDITEVFHYYDTKDTLDWHELNNQR